MKITPANYAIILLSVLVSLSKEANAQNLLANGGFEDLNTCYEFKSTCSPAAWFVTSSFNSLHGEPREGKRALWFCFDNLNTPSLKTFPYTKLLCPLKAGREYTLQLWIKTGKEPFSHLDVMCTPGDPARITNLSASLAPTFQFDDQSIIQKDDRGWMLLSKQFIAREDYNFLLFGNLAQQTESIKPKKNSRERAGNILYLVDDIRLTATDSSLNKCLRFDDNVKQLYAETRRHTNYVYLDEKRALLVKEKTRSVVQTPVFRSDTLVIPGVLFKSNSSVIDTGYQHLLDELILKIKDRDFQSVIINGHTDNTGAADFNKKLSVKRAAAVGTYLSDHLPKLKTLITENGLGDLQPVAPNDNEINKGKNRRVEIIIGYFAESK